MSAKRSEQRFSLCERYQFANGKLHQIIESKNRSSQKLLACKCVKAFLRDLKKSGFLDSNCARNSLVLARAKGRLSSSSQFIGQLQSGAI